VYYCRCKVKLLDSLPVENMDELLYRALLLDFYGELLTERQRKIFETHYLNDTSFNEAALELGTSRQAVWDIADRAEKALIYYDEKLALIERHMRINNIIEEINSALNASAFSGNEALLGEIRDKLKNIGREC
jgi:predicted DNA-binding protein YlxM (UPF0122 family)